MTVASEAISKIYPVAGGATAGLVTRGLLEAGRRFVVPDSKTPSGRTGGRTARVWTALSWAVSVGAGLYAGKKLVRPALVSSGVARQPAQS